MSRTMATSGASLPHRAISSIRGGSTAADGGQATGSAPRTPIRNVPNLSSTFNSPSSLRAEEDVIVIEFGSRKLLVGYAGDPVPKAHVELGPEQQRRVGDLRTWEPGYQDDWRKRASGKDWGKDHELWQLDIRGQDTGLVGDRLERALREAISKCVDAFCRSQTGVHWLIRTCRYLLIDSRPRRIAAVLPAGMPIPLIVITLETLFSRFHAPTVSLYSSPVASAFAAGVRSALIIDLGWAETVVTGVYEYREVQCNRSVRGGKLLVENTHSLLAATLSGAQGSSSSDGSKDEQHQISFEECEDIACRMLWCKPAAHTATSAKETTEGLATVTEQDESEEPESEAAAPAVPSGSATATIPLKSTNPPTKANIPHDQLSIPVESTFFDSQHPLSHFDDEELPLPFLVYQSLLKLPMDVRAICMSRIIFTGGCSKVLGLRGRIFDEVGLLVQQRGWDPVHGKSVEEYKSNPKLKRNGKSASNGATETSQQSDGGGGSEQDGVWHDAANAKPEVDPIDEQLSKNMEKSSIQGQLRAIESLGAWSGASMLSQLKVPALATVDSETWKQHGVNGATRPSEVDLKAHQRTSMGAGGLIRGAAGANWTLGVWGAL